MAMQMPASMKRSNLRFSLAMPLFFVVMFPLCYLTALHLPTPHDVPVAVAGAGAATFIAQVGPELAGKIDFIPAGSTDQARDMILNHTASAAYVPAPSGDSAQLLTAGANGRMVNQILPAIFKPVAKSSGNSLEVHDIAPLAPGDGTGIGLMLFMLIVVLVGFMSANILGNAAFFLELRHRVAICAGVAFLAPIILWAFTGPWLGIIEGSVGQIIATIAVGMLASFVTALITSAAVVFLSKWALFPAMLLFVFANIPSSDAAYPAEMVPGFFHWVSEWHLGAATVNTIRSILYMGGAGLTRPLVTMAVWLVVAIGAILAAAAYRRRQNRAQQETAAADNDDAEQAIEQDAVPEQESTVDAAAPALTGDVADARGTPLNNAAVTVLDPNGTQAGKALADNSGQFRISGLTTGTHLVIASAPGYCPEADYIDVDDHYNAADSADTTVQLRLSDNDPAPTAVSAAPVG